MAYRLSGIYQFFQSVTLKNANKDCWANTLLAMLGNDVFNEIWTALVRKCVTTLSPLQGPHPNNQKLQEVRELVEWTKVCPTIATSVGKATEHLGRSILSSSGTGNGLLLQLDPQECAQAFLFSLL